MKKFISIISLALILSMGICQMACGKADQQSSATDPATDPLTDPITTPITTIGTTAAITTVAPTTTTAQKVEDKEPVKLEYEAAVPKAAVQVKSFYQIGEPSNFSDKLTLATLQGLVANKCEDQIIINTVAIEKMKTYMFSTWNCSVNSKVDGKSVNLENLLKHYKGSLAGYILCADDVNSQSGSVAVSVAGLMNAVVATPANKYFCEKAGLKCLLDATNLDDAWLRSSEYFPKLNKKIAFEQPLSMAPKLIDYAVMSNSYVNFYNGQNPNEHQKMFEFLDDGAIVFGFNNTLGEYQTVLSFSKENIQLVASDHAYNLSTFSGLNLNTLTQKTADVSTEATPNKHTVCIILSDGDNLQWFTNDFTTAAKWWANNNRGKFNMGWGVPATMIDVAAPASKYLYSKMTDKDEFIMQISGLGYNFPSRWTQSARDEMAAKVAEYMKRADIDYAGILDDNGFNTESLSSFTKQEGIDGLFYIDFANYAGENGKILWSDGKPIVAARHRLWADLPDSSIEAIASAVNAADTDPTKASSYSFIIVHAWSGLTSGNLVPNGNTLNAVAKLVESFDGDVDVVTPSEFMNRIVKNNAK